MLTPSSCRKNPWRLSPTRKANLRKRMKRVDEVIAAVAESGVITRSLARAAELPKESEMDPRGEWGGACVACVAWRGVESRGVASSERESERVLLARVC